jgi:hypothetical protein
MMANRMRVPTGTGGPIGEAPRIFDGSLDQWETLSDQQRRYALLNLTAREKELLTKPDLSPLSHEEIVELIGGWDFERMEAQAEFLDQVAQHEAEIAQWAKNMQVLLERHRA